MARTRIALAMAMALLAGIAGAQSDENEDGYAGPVRIARIKIGIDGYSYLWAEGDSGPTASPDNPAGMAVPRTRPSTIMALIGIKPGDSFSQKGLDELVARRQKELSATNVFFTNRITVLPVRGDPALRSLRIDLRVGFPWRPSGGAAFASLGNANADGNLLTWTAALGYNYDAFAIGRGSSYAGPLWWSAGLSYSNNLLGGARAEHSLGSCLALGSAWLPLSPYLTAEGWSTWSLDSPTPFSYGFKATPGFSWSKTIGEGSRSLTLGAKGRCPVIFANPDFIPVWQPELRLQARPSLGPATIALQGGLDLTSARSAVSPLVAPVRGGFADPERPTMDRYALADAELRLNQGIIHFPCFITTVDLMPYGYFDVAAGSDLGSDRFFSDAIYAYGAGLRLRFGVPVMVCFDVSYGWSNEGLGLFSFSVSEGF
jgi:hypothetical protein